MKFRLAILLVTWVLATTPVTAHEFWMTAPSTPLRAGDTARLGLTVGEFFEGESLGFSAPQTLALRQYSAAGRQDLRKLLPPRGVLPSLDLSLPAAGTYLIAYDSQPNQIALSADRFHAYLHDEGLDFIKTQREANGTADKPGRERYRRHVKTLLRVSSALGANAPASGPDQTFATRTGQRLEIVPMADPLALRPRENLPLQVWFDDKPLAGALLKAWHKQAGQTLILRAVTTTEGKVTFNLPYAGAWMLSVVHMVPATGIKDVDWDSLWGNLTFHLPEASTPP